MPVSSRISSSYFPLLLIPTHTPLPEGVRSEVDFPISPEELSTGQRKEKRTPRPHQLEAINNVVEGLQKEDLSLD